MNWEQICYRDSFAVGPPGVETPLSHLPTLAISMSVVLDMKKCPKKSVGRMPVDVRTRITVSNAIGREMFLIRSFTSRCPSISAYEKKKVGVTR